MFSWDKLLCQKVLREKEKNPTSWKDYPMDPFEQDYREIVSSVSFRHLQNKTQVYQLSRDDFVRTRLTHSLEVSTIAKQIGTMMLFNSKWNGIPAFEGLKPEMARAVPTILAGAGLLHDMGNPPFGHEGEYAISAWFKRNLKRKDFEFFGTPIFDVLNEQMLTDLCNFDGNAQVIRTLAKCRYPSEEEEANVTFATMSTLLKYPVSSVEMNKNDEDMRLHKYGYFYSEQKLVMQIREETGMLLSNEPFSRNPLTYLLEAADDIAYVASDIEDAVSKKAISINEVLNHLKKNISLLPRDGDEKYQMQLLTAEGIVNNLEMRLQKAAVDETEQTEAFHRWTNYLRNWLMYITADTFAKNWQPIMEGTYKKSLLDDSLHKHTVWSLKEIMRQNVYPGLADIHIAANTIIDNILTRFCGAIIYWDTDRNVKPSELDHINLLPAGLRGSYMKEKTGDAAFDLYLRFRTVIDYVSNMSDRYILDLFKRLNAYSC